MHEVAFNGPGWWALRVLDLSVVALALFVIVDALRASRRAQVASRADSDGVLPWTYWVFPAAEVAFLASVVAVALVPGVSAASAVPALAAPFALGFGIAYLLRVVFPKAPADV